MVDTFRPPPPSRPGSDRRSSLAGASVLRSCTARELRELAYDMAGRLDRDAVDRADERAIDDAVEAAVVATLPQIVDLLDTELAPRLEALPFRARLALSDARRLRDLGLD